MIKVPIKDMLAYYPMNERGGQTAFEEIRKSHGILTNGASFKTNSLLLDGTNDYVDLGILAETSNISFLSVFCMAKITVQDGRNSAMIYRGNGASASRWALCPSQATIGDNDDILVLMGNGGNQYAYTTNNCLPLNKWVSVGFVFNGNQSSNATKMKVYVNGIQQTLTFSGTMPSTTYTNTTDHAWCGFYNTLNYFPGEIKRISIIKRAITPEEVKKIYINDFNSK